MKKPISAPSVSKKQSKHKVSARSAGGAASKCRVVQKIAPNLVLGVLAISVGALCLSPDPNELLTEGLQTQIYRCAGEDGIGVSLMFNVYADANSVYRILDTLQQYGATATFFIGGCWADDNVACLKAIHERGHELGNHGYFHKDHDKLSYADNYKEISACNRFIQLSVGVTPTLFAPPSGAYAAATLSAAENLGMRTVLWSKDTIDWRDHDAQTIYNRATKGVKKGDFILMHPTAETATALQDILRYYQTLHLKSITVSENLQEKGS